MKNLLNQENDYIYVIVRDDLSNSQKAVQSCHASIEATRHFIDKDTVHPHLILCVVKNEGGLKELKYKLKEAGIGFKEFLEADRCNEVTAIATRPLNGDSRRFFKRYKLLK